MRGGTSSLKARIAAPLIASLVLAGVVLAGLVRGAAAQETSRYGGELVFVVPAERPSFDAHREESFALVHPAAPHYNTLLRVDPDDPTGTKIVGDLAESWSSARNGRTWTFTLRRGVKFHDGSELTAPDVRASYDKIIFPPAGVASNRKGEYVVVEAVEKRLLDEEVHYIFTFQWHRIVPHNARLKGWTITPSHFLNNQLDTVWVAPA
jgi:ABC-type transport system substrate-binding protein